MEESDLKPPEGLFKKPLSMARSAFSKMILRAQQYDLVVKNRPCNQLHITDPLSCASQLESTSQADKSEVHFLVQIVKEKADEFKRETDSDPLLSKLKTVIVTGWPENRSEVEPELQDFWNFRDELCICDGRLMKSTRSIYKCSL